MKKLLLLLIIPLLNFGQDNCSVTDTVKLIDTFGGMYDDVFSLDFQSLTSKRETTSYRYADTDGDGEYNYDTPAYIKKDTTLEEYIISFDHFGWTNSSISWEEAEELIGTDFIINYTIKKRNLN